MMGPLLLNYVTLGPGHAFVMYANEPHAYLQGKIHDPMPRFKPAVPPCPAYKKSDLILIFCVCL